MNLLLSRHGNTFGPGDPVVWTGAANDLALVAKGLEQAEKFAQAMLAQRIKPVAVYCSPLQRTAKYAGVLVQNLALPFQPVADPRINEIDYGEWTGLTNEQVKERFGEADLKGWDERSVWPTQGRWGGSPATAIAEVKAFVGNLVQKHASNDTVVVVTSNGRLRYFLALIPGELEKRAADGTFKVKTGNVCKIVFKNSEARIPYWNVEPTSSVRL